MSNIVCRAVIEVLGKPKEHVESSLQKYLEKLEADEKYTIKTKDVAEIKKQDGEQELWTIFAEIEFESKKVEDVISFCFDYMPSIIEVLEPSELKYKAEEVSNFLNDMQAKLFQVDMVAKQLTMQNSHLQKNMAGLMKNFLLVLLGKNKLTLKQLVAFTGVPEKSLGDYLDKLIDTEKIELDGEHYYLKQ
ncbi:MAG: hypothetical protein ABIG93_01910 [archaeon]